MNIILKKYSMLLLMLCCGFHVSSQARRIIGDFNGDKRTDTLSFFLQETPSQRRIELPKTGNSKRMQRWIEEHQPVGVLHSPGLNNLYVGKGQAVTGLLYLQNCGDVNADGGEDIGLIKNGFDYSSVNVYELYSYRNGAWVKLYAFEIREYDIPKAVIDSSYFIRRSPTGKYIIRTWAQGEEIEVTYDLKEASPLKIISQ